MRPKAKSMALHLLIGGGVLALAPGCVECRDELTVTRGSTVDLSACKDRKPWQAELGVANVLDTDMPGWLSLEPPSVSGLPATYRWVVSKDAPIGATSDLHVFFQTPDAADEQTKRFIFQVEPGDANLPIPTPTAPAILRLNSAKDEYSPGELIAIQATLQWAEKQFDMPLLRWAITTPSGAQNTWTYVQAPSPNRGSWAQIPIAQVDVTNYRVELTAGVTGPYVARAETSILGTPVAAELPYHVASRHFRVDILELNPLGIRDGDCHSSERPLLFEAVLSGTDLTTETMRYVEGVWSFTVTRDGAAARTIEIPVVEDKFREKLVAPLSDVCVGDKIIAALRLDYAPSGWVAAWSEIVTTVQ